MNRAQAWLVPIALLLALIALGVRLYNWSQTGIRPDMLALAFPIVVSILLLIIWAQQRRSPGRNPRG